MTETSHRDVALTLARRKSVARARDFAAAGVPRMTLSRLVDEGVLNRPGRGLYQLADADISIAHSLAEAAQAAPKGVIGLLSALQFHQITTQMPHEIWMLLPSKAWAPTAPPVRLRILRSSEAMLRPGVERQIIDGVPVPITSPAKTIVDCFKYRGRVGLDVAIEALKDGLKQRKATRADLQRFAKICRVQNVMRPHLETLS